MKIGDYKIILVAIGLVSVLLFAYPSMGLVLHFPAGERFSELWVLGPGRMAEGYPFDVSAGRGYLVYLGVGNQLGRSAYYMVEVKLRNSTESLPNATAGVASPVPALYTYRVFLGDGQVWEAPLNFSLSGVVLERAHLSLINGVSINGASVAVDKVAFWDSTNNGFYYQLYLELYLFNTTSSTFSFDNRFVGFWLNMTKGS